MIFPFDKLFANSQFTVKRKHSITFRYLGIASIYLLVIQLIFGGVQIYWLYQKRLSFLEQKAEKITRFISGVAPEAILTLDFLSLEILIRQSYEDEDILYVIVVDEQQRPLTRSLKQAHSLIEPTQSATTPPSPLDLAEWFRAQDSVREIRAPILVDQSQLGEVWLGFSIQNVQQEVYQTGINILLASTAVSLLMAGFSIGLFERLISTPLRNLIHMAQALATGQLHYRSLIHAPDEIGQLEAALNSMAHQLQNTMEGLEQRIIERQTAEKRLQQTAQALTLARDKALAATRAKGEFLANMSHEIRTPMNAIMGMTKLALETSLTSQQQNYLTKINVAAESLLHVIDDILDFSKIEVGKLTLERVPFSIETVIKNLADVTSHQASTKGIELMFDLDVQTPQRLVGDPKRLTQILLNLISNAIKFTDSGHVLVTASPVEPATADPVLRFSVTDTGIGLTQAQQSTLFQAFTQGDPSTTRRYGGTGLGLVIAKRLTQLMDGEIGVESDGHTGSTFWFTARLGAPSLPLAPLSAKYRGLPSLACPVLVVEPSAAMSALLVKTLSSVGFSATVVTTAIAALDQTAYPLIIVNSVLPDSDGAALAQQMCRRRKVQSPAVLLITDPLQTGGTTVDQSAGMMRQLYKPLQSSILLDHLLALLTAATAPADTAKTSTNSGMMAADCLANIRVLLVEDNEINQELAVELLTTAGAIVTLANNGQEAYELVSHDTFDVVLMDCQMPVMDGYAATRHIRSLPQADTLPIIAMTANAMPGDQQHCLAMGMNDYLAKPIVKDALYAAILRWVSLGETVSQSAGLSMPMLSRAAAADDTFAHLPSFNTEAGLHFAGDNPQLYTKLLKQFLARYQDFDQQIQRAIAQDHYSEATRLAHGLKGTSATLGCEGLSDRARQLELSFRQQAAGFDVAALGTVNEKLVQVLSELDQWQQSLPSQSLATPGVAPIDWSRVLEQAHRLGEALETDLAAAFETINWLQTTLHANAQARTLVSALAVCIDTFETERAEQLLQQLRQLAKSHP